MNNPRKPRGKEVILSDGWSIPNENGVGRRVLVKGAAWTIPVVAMAAATPAAAASNTITLKFTNGPYTADACATVKTMVVQATDASGAPLPNTKITITLPAGLTWSDGTTAPRSFTTDADGNISVSGLKAQAGSGTRTVSATSGTASTSAGVKVTDSKAGAYLSIEGGTPKKYDKLTGSETPIGNQYFLDGTDLYYANTRIATGVKAAATYTDGDGRNDVTYTTKDGAYLSIEGGTGKKYDNRTGSQTPIGNQYFVDNGKLYYAGTLAETSGDVTQYSTYTDGAGRNNVTFTTSDGAYLSIAGGTPTKYTNLLSTDVPVGNQYFTRDGKLFYANTEISTTTIGSVTAAKGYTDGDGKNDVTFTTDSGAYRSIEGAKPTKYDTLTGKEKPVGNQYFTIDGKLYYASTLLTTAGYVTDAVGYTDGDGKNDVTFTTQSECS
ncbi:hypothetical protein C5C31_07925 [Rathayibacter rathayi]|uniref:Big-1 domain-containing protein n=1 Tax=Rathayibacter rathayi TaxID=33887 RepID=A0ABD6W5N4_RATRA|nr:carboxypeptidase-like regulatory domain-containing protein [Rathayibacter rathayi]AZZ50272.1 hypothetical protein C1O28_14610 [Rathayibacter rathayi]MWV74430.1 hypothetical protein [Rathayibacter rathayi NCPPB 2980 = VKM Ac-1601]PPF10382.1 hypothetical protein C5C04_13365 [Rathayibacter rathayi]PPF43248.1 hypothetical protein C5C08_14310 [Rathayibacter rathayi]PPF76538.1 hypothetical protein C5C14_13690 [Rathayibacter rathayi]